MRPATTPWTSVLAVSLDGSSAPAIFAAAGAELRRIDGPEIVLPPAPPTHRSNRTSASGLLPLDWNHDFRMDLVTAGRGGVRLLVQADDGTFADATAKAAGAGAAAVTDCVRRLDRRRRDGRRSRRHRRRRQRRAGRPEKQRRRHLAHHAAVCRRVGPSRLRLGRSRSRRRSRCGAARRARRSASVHEPAGRRVPARRDRAGACAT